MSLESLQSFLADDMHAVDRVIRERLYSDVALIRQVSEYIINSGGKRLRPALVLLSAGCFDYRGRRITNSPPWSSSFIPPPCCTMT